MRHHIHVKIGTAMRMATDRRSDQERIKRMFGYTSIVKLRSDLLAMQAEGYTVIPSAGCDHQAPTGECLGHPDKVPA